MTVAAKAIPASILGMAVSSQRRLAAAAHRRMSKGEQVNRLAGLALKAKPSVAFSGYWQRHKVA
jgi:hypothetical protein